MPDSELPNIELPLTPTEARRLLWLAYILGAVSLVCGGIVSMGVLSKTLMQVIAGCGTISYGLSWYFARKTPSATTPSKSAAAQRGRG